MSEEPYVPAAQTALLVPVPAAEPVVGSHRLSLDPSARWGVPAHITILFPFVPAASLTGTVVDRIESVLGSLAAFDFALYQVFWFGDQVLWLAPDPPDAFRCLIATLCDAFPEYPPYGGAFDQMVPHLTIGDRRGGASLAQLRDAEVDVSRCLPLKATAETVLLMAGRSEPGSWQVVQAFPLGGHQ